MTGHARSGLALLRVVAALSALAVCVAWTVIQVQAHRHTGRCHDQLVRLYRCLEQYELDRGTLPVLAYYPTDPAESPDSLRKVLERFGIGEADTVCPAAPRSLRDTGQTYIWNVALNGSPMPPRTQPVWMLVDLQGLDPRLPAPHGSDCHVLYSDGTVRRVRDPLTALPGL